MVAEIKVQVLQEIFWDYIPDDSTLHSHRCKNLKFKSFYRLYLDKVSSVMNVYRNTNMTNMPLLCSQRSFCSVIALVIVYFNFP
jgi:hypothetical protein